MNHHRRKSPVHLIFPHTPISLFNLLVISCIVKRLAFNKFRKTVTRICVLCRFSEQLWLKIFLVLNWFHYSEKWKVHYALYYSLFFTILSKWDKKLIFVSNVLCKGQINQWSPKQRFLSNHLPRSCKNKFLTINRQSG